MNGFTVAMLPMKKTVAGNAALQGKKQRNHFLRSFNHAEINNDGHRRLWETMRTLSNFCLLVGKCNM
jgi:hypothetical protein